jgi:hypothetical protein
MLEEWLLTARVEARVQGSCERVWKLVVSVVGFRRSGAGESIRWIGTSGCAPYHATAIASDSEHRRSPFNFTRIPRGRHPLRS